jgi:hypothetical protein
MSGDAARLVPPLRHGDEIVGTQREDGERRRVEDDRPGGFLDVTHALRSKSRDYADQAETLHELEYVIRARTAHDVRCSALRGGSGCDRRCGAANEEEAEPGEGHQADAAPRGHELEEFLSNCGPPPRLGVRALSMNWRGRSSTVSSADVGRDGAIA